MTVWYTSDQHFDHANIVSLCGRPFDSVEEMNEVLVDNYNSVVAPTDEVFMLGDVCMGKLERSLEYVKYLNGYKCLVPGNHDAVFSGRSEKTHRRYWHLYEEAGLTILPEFKLRELSLDKRRLVVLSHFPYVGDSGDRDRYVGHRPRDYGNVVFHGHVHEKWKTNGRQLNVGVDVRGFRPVSEDELIEEARQVLGTRSPTR